MPKLETDTYTGAIPELDEEDVLKSLAVLEDLVKGDTKSEEPDGDEDGDEDDDKKKKDDDSGENDAEGGIDDEAEKSLGSEFEETDEIQKAVEVSAFLADLVDSVRSSINDLRKAVTEEISDMKKSLSETRGFHAGAVERLIKAVAGETEKVSTLAGGMEDLKKSLSEFGNAPVGARKSTLRVIEKSFGSNDGGDPADNLRKSQVVDRLVKLTQEKDSGVTLYDVTKFEMNGQLRPEVMDRVRNG